MHEWIGTRIRRWIGRPSTSAARSVGWLAPLNTSTSVTQCHHPHSVYFLIPLLRRLGVGDWSFGFLIFQNGVLRWWRPAARWLEIHMSVVVINVGPSSGLTVNECIGNAWAGYSGEKKWAFVWHFARSLEWFLFFLAFHLCDEIRQIYCYLSNGRSQNPGTQATHIYRISFEFFTRSILFKFMTTKMQRNVTVREKWKREKNKSERWSGVVAIVPSRSITKTGTETAGSCGRLPKNGKQKYRISKLRFSFSIIRSEIMRSASESIFVGLKSDSDRVLSILKTEFRLSIISDSYVPFGPCKMVHLLSLPFVWHKRRKKMHFSLFGEVEPLAFYTMIKNRTRIRTNRKKKRRQKKNFSLNTFNTYRFDKN